jgi:hypothetical protein
LPRLRQVARRIYRVINGLYKNPNDKLLFFLAENENAAFSFPTDQKYPSRVMVISQGIDIILITWLFNLFFQAPYNQAPSDKTAISIPS